MAAAVGHDMMDAAARRSLGSLASPTCQPSMAGNAQLVAAAGAVVIIDNIQHIFFSFRRPRMEVCR